MNKCSRVPVTLYLYKQVSGQIWPASQFDDFWPELKKRYLGHDSYSDIALTVTTEWNLSGVPGWCAKCAIGTGPCARDQIFKASEGIWVSTNER